MPVPMLPPPAPARALCLMCRKPLSGLRRKFCSEACVDFGTKLRKIRYHQEHRDRDNSRTRNWASRHWDTKSEYNRKHYQKNREAYLKAMLRNHFQNREKRIADMRERRARIHAQKVGLSR